MNFKKLVYLTPALAILAACIPAGGPSGTDPARNPAGGGSGNTGPDHMVLVAGDLQTAAVGTAVAVKPKIRIVDASGNGQGGLTVNFTVLTGGGVVASPVVITDVNGYAETVYFLGGTVGTNTMRASSPTTIFKSTPTTITFTETSTVGAATKLAFSPAPSNTATAGVNFTTQPGVAVLDGFNNVVTTNNTASITLAAYLDSSCTIAAGAGFSATANPKTATSGVALFAGVKDTTAGTVYLKASAAGLTPACSGAISISPAAASKIVYTTQPPATATAGVNFTTQPVTAIQDTYNNTITTDNTSQVQLDPFTDSLCTVASTGTLSATNNPKTVSSGVATFAATQHSKSETIYIKATSGSFTTCSTVVNVAAAPASKLVFSTQPPANATAGVNFTTQPVVDVQDALGNVVTTDNSSAVTIAAYTDNTCTVASTGTFGATTNPLTVTSGVATFSGVNHEKAETIYLKATSGSLSSACSTQVVVDPAAASKLVFSTQPSTPEVADTVFGTQPVVQVQDAFNNVIVSDSSTQITLAPFTNAICTSNSSGTLSASTNPETASSGVATFAGVKHSKAESLYIQASSGGLTPACSSLVQITPAGATKVVFTTQPSGSATAGVDLAQQPVIEVQDALGNTITSDTTSQITLAAFTDASCTVASTGTFNATTNPLTVSAGVATFAGVNHEKAETIYLKATSGALTSDCSSAINVSPNTPNKIVFSTQPSTPEVADAVFGTQPVLQIQDVYNNVIVSDSASQVQLDPYTNSNCTTASTGTLSATTNPLTVSAGVATFAGVKHSKAESLYIKATSGAFSACSTIVNISAGAATKVVFSTQPSATATAGTNFGTMPVVQVQDAQSNVVTSDSSTQVTISAYTDNTCTTLSSSSIVASTNPLTVSSGVATFAGVKHNKAETIYLKASAGALTTDCSTQVVVSPGAAAKVIFSTQPSNSVVAGVNLAQQPIVQIQDAQNNVVASDSSSQVTLAAYTDNTCTVASTGQFNVTTNPETAASGVVTFAGVNHEKAETIYIKATSGALTTACSTGIVVSPAAASKLIFSTQPSTPEVADTVFGTQPVVQVQDTFGNVVVADSSTNVTLSPYTNALCSANSSGTLSATSNPETAAAGVVTFAGVKHSKSETLYIQASAAGLTPACSTLVNITAGAATKVVFSTQPSSSVVAGVNLAQQPVVQLQDANSNVVVSDSSSQVTLTAYSDNTCTTLSTVTIGATTNPLTVTSGVATFAGVKHTKAETLYIKASSGALTTDCSTLVTVSPAAASQIAFSTQPSTSGTAGVALTQQPVIELRDAYSNVIASQGTGTVTIDAYTDNACSVASSSTLVATTNPETYSSGVATFAGVKHNKAETLYIKATSSVGGFSACSTLVTISPAAASQIVFSTQPSTTGTAGVALTQQPVIEIQDAFSNVVTSQSTGSVTIDAYTDNTCTVASSSTIVATTNPLTYSSGVATFAGVKHNKAETLYIKATSSVGGFTACSTLSTISPAAASQIVFATQPSTTGTAGTVLAQQPVVEIRDSLNNIVASQNTGNVTIASYTDNTCTVASSSSIFATTNPVTYSAGVATFAGVKHNKAETLYIKATSSVGGFTTCSAVSTISPDVASKIVYSTTPSITAVAGSALAQQPVVQLQDTYNNVITSQNTGTITLASYTDNTCTVASSSSILATTNPVTYSAGVATFAGVKHNKAETLYIKATSSVGSFTVCSAAITVSPGSASQIVFSTQPSTTGTAGTALAQQPVVQILDAQNNVVASQNTGNVTIASYTDNTCTVASSSSILATTNPVTYSAGVATFAGVKHNKAETLYIKATSSVGGFTACSTLSTISPDVASKIVFSTQPSGTATAASAFAQQPVVQLRDTYDNVITSQGTGDVTLASYTNNTCTVASSSVIVATTNPVTYSAGVATFAGVKHNKAEALYIKATSSVGSFTACSTLVTVSAGAASQIIFSTQPPATGTAGTNLTTQPVVQILDAQNNVVASDSTSQVTLASYTDNTCSSASSSSILATTNPLTVTNGVATFAGVKHNKAESLYIKATSGAFTACSTLTTISPAAASKIVYSTTPSTTATAGTALTQQPVVQLQDTYNNVITSQSTGTVTLGAYTDNVCTVASSSAIVATTNPVTYSSGVATFAGVKHNKAETLYIKATSSVGSFTVCSAAITVSAGAATKVVFSTQPPATGTAGTNLSTQPVVQIQDANGNVVSSDSSSQVTLAAFTDNTCTTGSASSILATTNPLTVSSGVATFAGVKHTKAETLYIKASSGALTTACSTLTTISPAAASKVVFSTQPSAGTAGVVLATQPVVQLQDTYNNVITSQSTGTVTLAAFTNNTCTTAATGTFTVTTNPVTYSSGQTTFAGVKYTKAENLYIKATSSVGSFTACSSAAAISADVPDNASSTITTNPASGVVANDTATSNLTVTLIDQYGNPCSGVNVTVASDGSGDTLVQPGTTNSSGVAVGTIKSTVAETKTITITSPSGLTATDTVDFVAGPPSATTSTIVATPDIDVSANGTTTADVTITLLDAYGNPIAGQSVTFASTGTGNTLTQPGSTTDANGQATGTIASTVAETKTISIATPAGYSLNTVTNTVTFIVSNVSAANSDIQGTGPVVADGVATSTITITLRDTNNDPVAGITPVFNATNPGSGNSYQACSVSDASGVSTCTMKSTTAGVKTLSMTAPVSDTGGTVTFTRDVETPIEMLDVGVTGLAAATTFLRTRTTLDTSYYDGTKTYLFEATCINTGGSNTTLSLIDSAGTSKASLTITAGTTNPKRFSTTFTPTVASGADNYRIQTGANSTTMSCYTARMIVRQTGATKTRVYIPLIGANYNTVSNADTSAAAVDTRTNTTTYGQTTAARFSNFLYTSSEWGVLAATGWTFEGVQQTSTSSGARVRLYTTGGTRKATLPNSTTTISLASVGFASLTTATAYEVRHRGNTSSASNYLYRAGLWANVANIQKGVVCYRIAKRNTMTTTTVIDTARAEIDLSRFTNGTAYFESHGADSVAGTSNLDLMTLGTNDTGTSGSTISSSSIDYTSTTKVRTRTGALSITNGDRYVPQATVSSGTQDVTQSCALVIYN